MLTFRTRHYVAFIKKPLPNEDDEVWILFNDEKVVKAEGINEMKQYAYLYFFTRV